MRYVDAIVDAAGVLEIPGENFIGYAEDDGATTVRIDIAAWLPSLPAGAAFDIVMLHPVGSAWPVLADASPVGGKLSFLIERTSLTLKGTAKMIVTAISTDYQSSTNSVRLRINDSIPAGSAPEEVPTWIKSMIDAAGRANDSADAADASKVSADAAEALRKGAETGRAEAEVIRAAFYDGFDAALSAIKQKHTDVIDFGAKGDGVTSDKAAFISAFNYAVSNGKPIYVPDGIYNLDGMTYVATAPLRIIGQSKSNTILIGIGYIIANSDLTVESLCVQDAIGVDTFVVAPSGFSRIIINNVRATNTNSAFTDKTRANSFVIFTSDVETVGIEWLDINNCDISNFASYAFRLRGYVKGGTIRHNRISGIGYDTNPTVIAIFGGYQSDVGNVILANFKGVSIINNIIENIYSKKSVTDESGEGHAILCYGTDITIKDNTIKNIYGDGRLPENLDSGYDHEAIYVKSSNTVIEGNIIENGSGDNGQGAICIKAGVKNKVCRNIIRNQYGTGIVFEGVTDSEIHDNTVFLLGTVAPPSKSVNCVYVAFGSGICVRNNDLYHIRPISTAGDGSACMSFYLSAGLVAKGNRLYSSSDEGFHIGEIQSGERITISDNDIISVNSTNRIVYYWETATVELINNRFINNSNKNMLFINTNSSSVKGKLVLVGNLFVVNVATPQVINLDCLSKVEMSRNTFSINAATTRVIFNRIRGDQTGFCSILNNEVKGNLATDFLMLQSGTFNVGAYVVKDNTLNLLDGRLLSSLNGQFVTSGFCVLNNYIKTNAATDKTMLTGSKPAANYEESGNILK